MKTFRRFWPPLAKQFIVLLLLAAPPALQAEVTCLTNSDGLTLTVTGYSGPSWAVVIPSNIFGLSVVKIGDDAFDWATNITSVSVPNGVTNIGNDTFQFCFALTNVAIPAIESNVFSYDPNATVYYLPGAAELYSVVSDVIA